MADTKISGLTDGTTANATDAIPVARSGANYYITPGYIGTTLLGSTSLTGATVTTSQPVLNLSQTWNAGAVTFTGLKFNAATGSNANSAGGSLLLDLQLEGASKVSCRKDGFFLISGTGLGVANIYNTSGGICASVATFFDVLNQLRVQSNSILTSPTTATLQLGAADAAAPVAQTLQVQSVVAGTTNTAGANFTIKGSAGTGTGAGGSIIFQVAPAGTSGTAQNAYATALTIDSTRLATFTGKLTTDGINSSSYSVAGASFAASSNFNVVTYGTTNHVVMGPSALDLKDTYLIQWRNGSNAGGGTPDVILARDAANTLALRNGTSAQTFNVYNTYTDASNYERGYVRWNSNIFQIGVDAAGSGTTTRTVRVYAAPSVSDTGFGYVSSTQQSAQIAITGTIGTTTIAGGAGNKLQNFGGGFQSLKDYAAGVGGSRNHFHANNSNETTAYFGLAGSAAGVMQINNATGTGSGYGAAVEMWEMTAPSAPATNGVRIYAEDNGSGKTRLMALFATGAAVQIAIEP